MASKIAKVVIGANFGDEGKGLLTDHFATTADLVVRFNGGAQAGHTVQAPEGPRHVFSHFGSGTMCSVPTFLSHHFVVNPILFVKELKQLQAFMSMPRVFVDSRCLVTTPYDMMLNQWIEEARGVIRHGSVGVGFGETIERSIYPAYHLTVRNLNMPRNTLLALLRNIRDEWVPKRAAQFGLDLTDAQIEQLCLDNIMLNFIDDCEMFMACARVASSHSLLPLSKNIVFEGAQGLLLDQNHPNFPHVTRSNTGLKNVMQLADIANISRLDTIYCTRTYLTRHGAGYLAGEVEKLPFEVCDPTNQPNAWQGSLRFAPLDVAAVVREIEVDLQTKAPVNCRVNPMVAVTCCDQSGDAIADAIFDQLCDELGVVVGFRSHGPTRATIEETHNVGAALSQVFG